MLISTHYSRFLIFKNLLVLVCLLTITFILDIAFYDAAGRLAWKCRQGANHGITLIDFDNILPGFYTLQAKADGISLPVQKVLIVK